MNALGIVLIARLGSLCGITNVNDTERMMILGHLQRFLKIAFNSLVRICSAPNSTKSEVGSAKEYIFYSGRAILNPILCKRRRECSLGVTANDNNQR